MRYRTLGSTGLEVSVVGVGTWQFGGEWGRDYDKASAAEILATAKDSGINLIDTAECYGDHLSEQLIGAAIEKERDDWILATKFGHKFHGHMDRTEPRSPQDVQIQLEESLKALRTDYVDVYQYHSWGDDQFFDDDVLATLHKLQDQGKFKHLANSIGSNVNQKQVQASKDRNIEAIQLIYNRLDTKPEDTTLPICREQNLGVLARVPLASGFLSGKYKPDDAESFARKQNDVRAKRDPSKIREQLEHVQRIRQAEVPSDLDMATWALAWCLRQPAVTCVIPGCKDPDQVRKNAAAADVEL